MNYTWFKLHHELPDDIKMRKFTPQEKWAWVVLLCLASKSSSRGTIHAHDDDIAEYCEFNTTQDWLYYRDKLIAKGMLEFTHDGGLRVEHWENRQYDKPSDRPEAVKARVAKHRAKKKGQNNDVVTPCNAIQTPCNEQTRLEEIRSDQKTEDQITYTDPDAQPDQKACVKDSFDQPEPPEQSACVKDSRFSKIQYEQGRSFSEQLLMGYLPPWRTGRGVNDWDEDVCQEYVSYWQEKSKKVSLSDAKSYFNNAVLSAKEGKTEKFENALGRYQELRDRVDRRKARAASSASSLPVSAPPQPLTPDEIAERKAGIERARRAYQNGAA